MRYYISDMHFFHENLNTRMDTRGFPSVEEMNRYMIFRWNRKVRKNDEVVILGDFSVEKGVKTNEILEELKGIKYLITGNHDRFLKDRQFKQELFRWIHPYAEMNDNGRKVILSHYPIMCYNGQYQISKKGGPKSYMLYGHVHDTYDEYLVEQYRQLAEKNERIIYGRDSKEPQPIPCHMINCFCMFSDYVPLTLDEWIENDRCRMEKKTKEST